MVTPQGGMKHSKQTLDTQALMCKQVFHVESVKVHSVLQFLYSVSRMNARYQESMNLVLNFEI